MYRSCPATWRVLELDERCALYQCADQNMHSLHGHGCLAHSVAVQGGVSMTGMMTRLPDPAHTHTHTCLAN